MEKSNIGSSFDEFLQEESLLEEVTDTAIERVVNWLLPEASEYPKALGLQRVVRSSAKADVVLLAHSFCCKKSAIKPMTAEADYLPCLLWVQRRRVFW